MLGQRWEQGPAVGQPPEGIGQSFFVALEKTEKGSVCFDLTVGLKSRSRRWTFTINPELIDRKVEWIWHKVETSDFLMYQSLTTVLSDLIDQKP